MAAAVPLPIIATAGKSGLNLLQGLNGFQQIESLSSVKSSCRVLGFSKDGSKFGYCDTESFKVLDMANGDKLFDGSSGLVSEFVFSPRSSYLATYFVYNVAGNRENDNNVNFFDLKSKTVTDPIRSVMYRNSDWKPQWTEDEKLCAIKTTNEVQFYSSENVTGTAPVKLYLNGVTEFAIAPGPEPYHIATYSQGKKGNPSIAKLFRYPDFDEKQQLANKGFFKSDKCDFYWNKKGTAVLILCSVEIDATGSSYYGEQTLHFMSTRGDSNMVQLDKNGPVYSVDWNSNSSQFAVVFGYMPAKASLFNLKCEPIFDYGSGPRNVCRFNPHGNILCLAGTGNLRGNFEMWNVQGNKKINQSMINDVTYFDWCSNSEHLLTATLAPRLNVNNGFAIRNVLKDPSKPVYKFDSPVELNNAIFQPQAASLFPQPKLTLAPKFQEKKAEAYRPPSVRDGVYVPVKDKFQSADNQKGNENLSAAALKNKKKREAKARAKQEQEQVEVVSPTTAITAAPDAQSSGDPDLDKKIRAIRKKLKQIDDLKSKQKEGKVLEQNQLDKLNSEDSLLKELKSLQI